MERDSRTSSFRTCESTLKAKCRKNQNHPKTPYFCLKRKAFLEIRTKNDSQIWINLASPRFIVCLPIISCERFAWKRSVPAPQAAASGVPAAPALSDATRLARFSSWPPTWTQILESTKQCSQCSLCLHGTQICITTYNSPSSKMPCQLNTKIETWRKGSVQMGMNMHAMNEIYAYRFRKH